MTPLDVFDYLLGVLRFARKNYPTRVLVVGMRPHVARTRTKGPEQRVNGTPEAAMVSGQVLLHKLPPDFIHALRDPNGELIFIVRIRRSVIERMESPIALPAEKEPS